MRLGIRIIMGCGEAIRDIMDDTIAILRRKGYDVTDASTLDQKSGDFADAAETVAKGIQSGAYQRGVVFCGSGIGACMAANKFRGIRAGLAYDVLPAALGEMDYGTNVLCSGAWMLESAEACARMLEPWLLVGYAIHNVDWMKTVERIESQKTENHSRKQHRVAVGCDVNGIRLKTPVLDALRNDSMDTLDVTGDDAERPAIVAERACKAILSGECDQGILLSETGQGMNIVANKFAGIRSGICYEPITARLSKADTDANVLCLGAWCAKSDEAVELARIWIRSRYEDKNVYSLERFAQFETKM